jgi:beta-glucosidase
MTNSGWLASGWRTQHLECCALGRTEESLDLVLLGDSLIQGWGGPGRSVIAVGAPHWERFFGGRRAGNLGIAGDCVRHVAWRLEHGALDGLTPQAIVLHVGTNDLAAGAAPEQVAAGVLDLVRAIRARAPQARIWVHAILPRGGASDPLRTAVAATNGWLAQRVPTLDPACGLLDPGAALLDGAGELRAGCFEADSLHLTADGYAAWGAALLPLLGSEPPPFANGAARALEPAWVAAERTSGAIFAGFLALAGAIAVAILTWTGALEGGWRWIAGGGWLGFCLLVSALARAWPRWEYRHRGYRLCPDRVEVWGGLLWRRSHSVPIARVQYTDVSQGPLARRHGIATLVIHTAGTEGAQVEAPGLPHALAVEVRDWLVDQTADDAV